MDKYVPFSQRLSEDLIETLRHSQCIASVNLAILLRDYIKNSIDEKVYLEVDVDEPDATAPLYTIVYPDPERNITLETSFDVSPYEEPLVEVIDWDDLTPCHFLCYHQKRRQVKDLLKTLCVDHPWMVQHYSVVGGCDRITLRCHHDQAIFPYAHLLHIEIHR